MNQIWHFDSLILWNSKYFLNKEDIQRGFGLAFARWLSMHGFLKTLET